LIELKLKQIIESEDIRRDNENDSYTRHSNEISEQQKKYFDRFIIGEGDTNIFEGLQIEELHLSTSSYNCLRRGGIRTIFQLLMQTYENLSQIRNLGKTHLTEIEEAIRLYTKRKSMEKTFEGVVPESKISKTSKMEIFFDKSGHACKDILIEELDLSVRSYNQLKRSGVTYFSQLLYMSDDEIMNIKNIGKKSAIELRQKISSINYKIITNNQYNLSETAYQISKFEECQKEYLNINPVFWHAKIETLLTGFLQKNTMDDTLIKMISSLDIVKSLSDLFESWEGSYLQNTDLCAFIKYLNYDFLSDIDCFFEDYSDNWKSILMCRENGGTLEKAAQILGVTRERVRQIERRIQQDFNSICKRKNWMLILSSICDRKTYLDVIEISNIINEKYSKIFIYLLKNSKNTQFLFSIDMGVFLIGNDMSAQNLLIEFENALSKIVSEDELSQIEYKLATDKNLKPDFVTEICRKNLYRYGKFYSKTKLTNTDLYNYVLENFFASGYKIDDTAETSRLRYLISNSFGTVNLPVNDRAIDARIMDIGILCGRGTYKHKKGIEKFEEIANKVSDYFSESQKTAISFLEIFDKYKDEIILKWGIENRYQLQGILKYYLKDKYYFSRDYISKTDADDISTEIVNYIAKNNIVSKDKLRKCFKGISEAMLFQILSRSSDILIWGFGEYIHSNKLQFDQEDVERLSNELKMRMGTGYVNSKKLYSDLYINQECFFQKNRIDNHMAFFSVLEYIFSDAYNFSRPIISMPDTGRLNANQIVKDYISTFEQITISEVKEFLDETKIGITSIPAFFDSFCDEYIRADEDLLVKIENLNLSKAICKEITDTLLAFIKDKGYIAAQKFNGYPYFPNIGVKWSPYLLVSLVRMGYIEVSAMNPSPNWRYIREIFYQNDIGVDNYDQLLYFALKQENLLHAFDCVEDIENYLKDQALIINSIPESLYSSGYLIRDNEKVTVVS